MNALLYDLIIVLILAWCAYRGYRRGLILTVSSLLVLLCAIFAANILSTMFAPMVSEAVAPKMEAFLQEQVSAHVEDDATLESLLEDTQLEALLPYVESDIILEVESNVEGLATEAIASIAQALATGVVKILLWIVAFVAVSALLNIVVRAVDLVAKLPVLRTVNTLGGLATGAIKGVIVVYIVLILLGWFDYLPEVDVAEQTLIYSKFMVYNPVKIAIL